MDFSTERRFATTYSLITFTKLESTTGYLFLVYPLSIQSQSFRTEVWKQKYFHIKSIKLHKITYFSVCLSINFWKRSHHEWMTCRLPWDFCFKPLCDLQVGSLPIWRFPRSHIYSSGHFFCNSNHSFLSKAALFIIVLTGNIISNKLSGRDFNFLWLPLPTVKN